MGKQSFGAYLPEKQVDEIDKLKRDLDSLEDDTVSRSEVLARILRVGLPVFEQMHKNRDTYLPDPEQRAIAKQMALDYYRRQGNE
jgi:hypothetical protein